MVGMGWWGKTLVESVQGVSPDLQFVAAVARTHTDELKQFCAAQKLTLATMRTTRRSPIRTSTRSSWRRRTRSTARRSSRRPRPASMSSARSRLRLTKADAEAAVAATTKAGVTLGLGYNRRFHPEMTRLRQQIRSGELGTMLHVEATMTFPNGLFLKPDAWRADKHETPCGALTPMGVHAIDGMIDLCGPIAQVYCQSFRRVVAVDSDDTTSMLFRMKDGMSGYLGTMTATGPGFSFQVFGSKGSVRLEGMTHVAGASSEERRTRLFGTCKFQPIKGEAVVWEAARLDVTRACLDAFGQAASGRAGVSDPARPDGPRRGGDGSRRAVGHDRAD